MKSMILIQAENHVALAVYQESNNSGDQILTYRFEALDGRTTEHVHTESEGNWVDWTKKDLLKIWYNVDGPIFGASV